MCRVYTVLSSERGCRVHQYLQNLLTFGANHRVAAAWSRCCWFSREGPESSVMLPLSGNRTSLNIVFIIGWCVIAFLDSCHRLFIALLGSGLTALITLDARCLIRTMLYYQS